MSKQLVEIVVFVPSSYTELVKKVMGDAGAGSIGNYSHCSYSVKGTSTFLPLKGANPTIGSIGDFQNVEEDRIECWCLLEHAKNVISAIKSVHPYEEVPVGIYPLLREQDL